MTTKIRRARKDVTAPITTAPTDGSGTFTGAIHPFEIDSDNERIENFTNLPATLPTIYMHSYGDPGAVIGEVYVSYDKRGNLLKIAGKLFLKDNPQAVATYERMLLPDDDPLALREFSIGFAYERSKTFKGEKGETVIPDAELLEVSVVYRGAQRTELVSIKTLVAQGAKYVYTGLEGSWEATEERLRTASQAWADDEYGTADADRVYANLVGTFPDHCVVSIERSGTENEYLSFPYTLEDGEVSLAGPTPIDLTLTAMPASKRLWSWTPEDETERVNALLDELTGQRGSSRARDQQLRDEIEIVDAIATSHEHSIHSNEIRALNDRINKLAETSVRERDPLALERERREAEIAEQQKLRDLIDSGALNKSGR